MPVAEDKEGGRRRPGRRREKEREEVQWDGKGDIGMVGGRKDRRREKGREIGMVGEVKMRGRRKGGGNREIGRKMWKRGKETETVGEREDGKKEKGRDGR